MYFDSGHVTDMQDSKIVEENHYCVRSLVLSSYRKDQYNVFVMLHEVTGKVLDARCHCEVSAMGRCSHVSALLYAILDYKTMFEKKNIPCTSKLCTWRQHKVQLVDQVHGKYFWKHDMTIMHWTMNGLSSSHGVCKQNSPQWYKLRKLLITGSMIANYI